MNVRQVVTLSATKPTLILMRTIAPVKKPSAVNPTTTQKKIA